MGKKNYEIYIENSTIGTKLSLGKQDILGRNLSRWAVEEDFNGPSVPAKIYETESFDGRISDYIYGFYKEDMIVTLTLFSKNNRVAETIENVKILKKEVS